MTHGTLTFVAGTWRHCPRGGVGRALNLLAVEAEEWGHNPIFRVDRSSSDGGDATRRDDYSSSDGSGQEPNSYSNPEGRRYRSTGRFGRLANIFIRAAGVNPDELEEAERRAAQEYHKLTGEWPRSIIYIGDVLVFNKEPRP